MFFPNPNCAVWQPRQPLGAHPRDRAGDLGADQRHRHALCVLDGDHRYAAGAPSPSGCSEDPDGESSGALAGRHGSNRIEMTHVHDGSFQLWGLKPYTQSHGGSFPRRIVNIGVVVCSAVRNDHGHFDFPQGEEPRHPDRGATASRRGQDCGDQEVATGGDARRARLRNCCFGI